jgi:hypothetical protein
VPLQIQAHYNPDSRNRAFDTHTIPYAFKTHVIIVMSAHTLAHFGEMSVRIDDFGPGLPTAQPGLLLPVLRVVSVDAAAGPGRTALGSGPKTAARPDARPPAGPAGPGRQGARWSELALLHAPLQLQWSSNTCRAAILANPEG